jgi:tetratricopeptide (TPR) repeat protein
LSSAAVRSYIVEANFHASVSAFDLSQQALVTLAQTYPSSVLAPQALFEAAVYAEQRGPDYFADSIRLQNELSDQYASNPLVFSARLRQGDLLRQMNDFAAAQVVYENLINRYPDHPRRYVAELSRADCLLALAKTSAAQLQDVALALERLIDLPNLPFAVQVEIGYKWGFALVQRGAISEAIEVYSMMMGRFLLESERVNELGSPGRYWISRILLELGTALESQAKIADARQVYRKMIAYDLLGSQIAQSKLVLLQNADNVEAP